MPRGVDTLALITPVLLRNTWRRGVDSVSTPVEVRLQVLRMVEDEEGEATMACKLPSSSARKAFNQEDEEDEFDRLACESLQRLRCRPKPALKTQVWYHCDFGVLHPCVVTCDQPRCAHSAQLSTCRAVVNKKCFSTASAVRIECLALPVLLNDFVCRSLSETYMTA